LATAARLLAAPRFGGETAKRPNRIVSDGRGDAEAVCRPSAPESYPAGTGNGLDTITTSGKTSPGRTPTGRDP
jgi:hypothetical protein